MRSPLKGAVVGKEERANGAMGNEIQTADDIVVGRDEGGREGSRRRSILSSISLFPASGWRTSTLPSVAVTVLPLSVNLEEGIGSGCVVAPPRLKSESPAFHFSFQAFYFSWSSSFCSLSALSKCRSTQKETSEHLRLFSSWSNASPPT